MALTSQQIQDIYNRTAQIYTEMGNTPQANAQIAREARAAGLSAADLATALNVPEAQVIQLAAEAGEPLSSVNPFGDSNITVGGDTSGITTGIDPFAGSNGITLGGGGNNIDLTGGGSSVTLGGGSGITTGVGTGTGGITDLGTSGNGITLGGGGTNIDLTTGGSGITVGGDTSGITTGVGVGAPPSVDLSGLTAEQQGFAQTLPVGLQDDYLAYVAAGGGDETSGATIASLAELLKGRGLSFDEAAQATGLTADNPNYQEAVRAYYGLAPTSTDLTPGGMQQFSYTDFPGGIYGPGQQMPNIFVPAAQQQPAAPPAAPGPRTMVSPGITTYAYPQPFGEIDIFGRPTATPPTAYTPPPPPATTGS